MDYPIASEGEESLGEDVLTDPAIDLASDNMSDANSNGQQGTINHIQQQAGSKGSVC